MASSSSSTTPPVKYDFFLSFRGEDTGDNFTSRLYTDLCRKKIQTFINYELKRGDEISPSLLNAIEESRISIVVFSKGYAYSRSCLEELGKILECKNRYGQIVVPVFYNVDPSYVSNQIGTFAEAFAKLEGRFKDKVEKLKTWRTSLSEAANLSGWESRLIRPDSLFIEEIVNDILKRLNNMSLRDDKEVVGISKRYLPSTSSSSLPENNPDDPEMAGFPFLSPIDFRSLTYLHLNDCGIIELPGDLGRLSSLKALYLRRNNLRIIPASIKDLTNLIWLSISNCERLQSIPELPRDLELEAHDCTSLRKLLGLSTRYSPYPWMRQAISFVNCFQLDDNAHSHVAQYAMLKLSLMASAMLKGFIQAQRRGDLPNACICVPGSEISYWFDLKNMGSRIILDLIKTRLFEQKLCGVCCGCCCGISRAL